MTVGDEWWVKVETTNLGTISGDPVFIKTTEEETEEFSEPTSDGVQQDGIYWLKVVDFEDDGTGDPEPVVYLPESPPWDTRPWKNVGGASEVFKRYDHSTGAPGKYLLRTIEGLPGDDTPGVDIEDIQQNETIEIKATPKGANGTLSWQNPCGTECIVGILGELRRACDTTHALKIDSDVLWNRAGWLAHLTADTPALGMRARRSCWYGLSYILREDTIDTLRHSVLSENWDCCLPADRTIGRHLQSVPGTVTLDYNHNGGPFAFYDARHDHPDHVLDAYLRKFDLITLDACATIEQKERAMMRLFCHSMPSAWCWQI